MEEEGEEEEVEVEVDSRRTPRFSTRDAIFSSRAAGCATTSMPARGFAAARMRRRTPAPPTGGTNALDNDHSALHERG